MKYTINNTYITIEINSFGAELSSLKKMDDPYEYLWQGDSKYWARQAPVLFPVIGALKNNQYTYNSKIYKMSKHGFARDSEFVCDFEGENKLVFKLTDSPSSLEVYPFKFDFYIAYELVESTLVVSYKVVNSNDCVMPFSVGAHPAFKWDSSAYFEFDEALVQSYEVSDEGIVLGPEVDLSKQLPIHEDMFSNDALIYAGVNKTSLVSDRRIDMTFDGFPYLGLWSKPGPFVCIEPWYGIADMVDHDGLIMNKLGIQKLAPNEVFEASYTISI